MNMLRDYIEWVRKQMKREEETPSSVEQKVQDIAPIVHVPLEQKPKRTRKKKNEQA